MAVNAFRDVYPAESCSALREQRKPTDLEPRDVGDEPRTQQALPLWSSAPLQRRQTWHQLSRRHRLSGMDGRTGQPGQARR
jgi:hypothetical protein